VNRQKLNNVRMVAVLLAVAGIAGGCASTGGLQAQNAKEYCAERYADARLAPIKDKIVMPISVDEPQPIEILANKSLPTEPEREAIRALSEIRSECIARVLKENDAPPAYRVKSHDEITVALADLYAREISYGEFARRVLFIGDRDKAAREDLEFAIRQRERWRNADAYN
jgi:hypothetical protein